MSFTFNKHTQVSRPVNVTTQSPARCHVCAGVLKRSAWATAWGPVVHLNCQGCGRLSVIKTETSAAPLTAVEFVFSADRTGEFGGQLAHEVFAKRYTPGLTVGELVKVAKQHLEARGVVPRPIMPMEGSEMDPTAVVQKALSLNSVVRKTDVRSVHKQRAAAWLAAHPSDTPEQALAATLNQRLDVFEALSEVNPPIASLYRVAVDEAAVGKVVAARQLRDDAQAALERLAGDVAKRRNITKQLAYGEILGQPDGQRLYQQYVSANARLARLEGR